MAKKKKRKPLPPRVRKAASKALKGNSFWQQRSKHGVDALFTDPKKMLGAACEYFNWCDENPIMKAENKVIAMGHNMGSSVELHEEPLRRPYSLLGVCRYMDVNSAYLRQFENTETYKGNKDFATVISKIKEIVADQQFEGATAGQFNANIISRMLGLVDKKDITTDNQPISAPIVNVYKGNAPDLSNEESNVDIKRKTDE